MVGMIFNVQWSIDDPHLVYVWNISVVMATIGDTTVGREG